MGIESGKGGFTPKERRKIVGRTPIHQPPPPERLKFHPKPFPSLKKGVPDIIVINNRESPSFPKKTVAKLTERSKPSRQTEPHEARPVFSIKEIKKPKEVTQEFREHMTFKILEKNPWRVEFVQKHLRRLGATNLSVASEIIAGIKNYGSDKRFYHGPDHAIYMGQDDVPDPLEERLTAFTIEEAGSLLVLEGGPHDEAYKRIDVKDGTDEGAWSEETTKAIDGNARYTRTIDEDGEVVFRTYLTKKGMEDGVTKMVAGIFGVGEDGILSKEGGEEFDSALANAKRAEKAGIKPHFIIAKAVMCAGTIPFRESVGRDADGKIVHDGEMGKLQKKARNARLELNGKIYQLTPDQVNDTMFLTVHLANRDIGVLLQPNNGPFVADGGRQVKHEEVRALRKGVKTVGDLVEAATLETSAPLLYEWISNLEEDTPINAADVPDIYFPRDNEGNIIEGSESYPPREVYEAAKIYCQEDCDWANAFNRNYRMGPSLAAAIATLVDEPTAPVPGFVDAKQWHPQAVPQGKKLSPEEQIMYQELSEGIHQSDVSSILTKKSRLSGAMYAAMGHEKAAAFTAYLQKIFDDNKNVSNPFADRQIAQHYFDTAKAFIGEENMRTILTELHRVAIHYQDDPEKGNKERAANIKRLAKDGKLQVYKSE